MSNNGWVKLHRTSLESSVFEDPKTWMIWCWCLMKASHTGKKFPFNGKDMTLTPGQFVCGRNKALKELKGISAQSYRTALAYLISTSRITIQTTNRFSIITITKWDEYQQINQPDNQPLTNKQPATNQPLTTYKKDQ